MSKIKAGEAYIEIFANDSKLRQGLDATTKRIKSWANQIQSIGLGIFAAGSALATPLLGAAVQFGNVGSAMSDLAAQTGMGTESLSRFQYAAAQTNASAEAMAGALVGMNKFSTKVAMGLKKATNVLDILGISAKDYLALKPEERFLALADALAKVKDEQIRGGLASLIFGGSGQDIAPLLAGGAQGLRDLMNQAKGLGIGMKPEDVEAANRLNDSFGRMLTVVQQVGFTIGASVAGPLQYAIDSATLGVAVFGQWLNQNRGIALAVGSVAAGLVAVGSAVLVVSSGLFVTSGIVAGISAGMALIATTAGVVSAAIAAGTAPLWLSAAAAVLIGAGLAGAVVYAVAFAQSLQPIRDALSAISTSLVSGEFANAWKVAAATANLVWVATVGGMKILFADFVLSVIRQLESINDALPDFMRSDMAGKAIDTMQAGVEKMRQSVVMDGVKALQEQQKAIAAANQSSADARSAFDLPAAPSLGAIDISALMNVIKTGSVAGTPSGNTSATSSFGFANLSRTNPANERAADAAEKTNELLENANDVLDEIAGNVGGAVFV